MNKALVLQHIEAEPPGLIGEALISKGFDLEYCHGYQGQQIPKTLEAYEALVVMGGPMGVYEADQFSFLKKEIKLIENALKLEKPILGVCLGSQLLAHVLGAKVYPGPQKEIGWYSVDLCPDASKDQLLKNTPRSFIGFHWHGDIFDLPAETVCLAKSELTACQAYRYGTNVYGFLFHMEVNREMIHRWTGRFSEELTSAKINSDAILQKSAEYLKPLQITGREVFTRWAETINRKIHLPIS